MHQLLGICNVTLCLTSSSTFTFLSFLSPHPEYPSQFHFPLFHFPLPPFRPQPARPLLVFCHFHHFVQHICISAFCHPEIISTSQSKPLENRSLFETVHCNCSRALFLILGFLIFFVLHTEYAMEYGARFLASPDFDVVQICRVTWRHSPQWKWPFDMHLPGYHLACVQRVSTPWVFLSCHMVKYMSGFHMSRPKEKVKSKQKTFPE